MSIYSLYNIIFLEKVEIKETNCLARENKCCDFGNIENIFFCKYISRYNTSSICFINFNVCVIYPEKHVEDIFIYPIEIVSNSISIDRYIFVIHFNLKLLLSIVLDSRRSYVAGCHKYIQSLLTKRSYTIPSASEHEMLTLRFFE